MRRVSAIILGLVFVVILIYIGNRFYQYKYFTQTNDPVTLRFHYMQYACGDCYPQWNADSILEGSQKKLQFLGKDMEVIYKEKPLYDQLGEAKGDCIICSDFFITGKIERTMSGKYKMIAEQYNSITDSACCNN